MVLESIFTAKTLIKKPLDMLILSFVVATASIFISYIIFPAYAGIIFTLLIAVAFAPLILKIFTLDIEAEEQEARKQVHRTFLDRHDEAIKLYSLFFIGTFLSILILSSFMPQDFITTAFSQQISEIQAIRSIGTGGALSNEFFNIIMFNNLRVMGFAFLLSFIIGTGAIFILSWNASILGIFLGNFVRDGLFNHFFMITAGIFPHAIIEIGAYFLAGIAGGVLSKGVIREKFLSPEFKLVFKDSLILLGLAVLAVILGAGVEVWL